MNNNNTVSQLIDASVAEFYESVHKLCDVGPYQKLKSTHSALGSLDIASSEFYENQYYVIGLEDRVRKYLVTDILIKLFTSKGAKCSQLKLKGMLLTARDTYAYEKSIPLEFIVNTGRRIGICYTPMEQEDVEKLVIKHKLSHIIRINWIDSSISDLYNSQIYEELTPTEFFARFFTLDNYDIYTKEVTSAIKKAREAIGIETIHKLSHRYLSDLRLDISADLSLREYQNMRYKVIPQKDGSTPPDLAHLGQLTFTPGDYKILSSNFIDNCLYKALLGSESFATCFITAEYMYKYITAEQNFDYTAVACCYLKSVEELIYRILEINLKYPNQNIKPQETLWIMKNSKTIPASKYIKGKTVRSNPNPNFDATQVIFEVGFKTYFNTTLTPMINFLHDNKNGWNISSQGQDVLYQFLENYVKDFRNDHFHKDNIDDYTVIEHVRNNTILIIYALLGGYRLTGTPAKDISELGILDDSFDRFYKNIKQSIPRSQSRFILYYPDQQPIKAFRHYVQDLCLYDRYGLLTPSRIRFVKTDDFSSEAEENAMNGKSLDNEFFITSDNMPERISLIVGKEERFISW